MEEKMDRIERQLRLYELDLSLEIKGRAVLCRFYKKWDVIL